MRITSFLRGSASALTAAVVLSSALAVVQAQQKGDLFAGDDPNEGPRIPASQAEGRTIDRVYIHLVNPTGDPARDQQAVRDIEAAFGAAAGDTFVHERVASIEGNGS